MTGMRSDHASMRPWLISFIQGRYGVVDILSKMDTTVEPCSSGVEELTIGLVTDRQGVWWSGLTLFD
jgi:hypothetical protein